MSNTWSSGTIYATNPLPLTRLPTRYSVGVWLSFQGVEHGFPDEIVARLQPETKELASVRQSSRLKLCSAAHAD